MKINQIGRITLAIILSVVLAACASTEREASTGEQIDDTVLTSRVKAALLQNPDVSGIAVNVESFKGTVQLSGFVKSATERNQAVKVARDIPGVKRVKNDILIR